MPAVGEMRVLLEAAQTWFCSGRGRVLSNGKAAGLVTLSTTEESISPGVWSLPN